MWLRLAQVGVQFAGAGWAGRQICGRIALMPDDVLSREAFHPACLCVAYRAAAGNEGQVINLLSQPTD
jgi:hypothetical protein